MPEDLSEPELHWEADDIERKVGFKGARYTGTNTFLTFGLGFLASVIFYLSLAPFTQSRAGKMFYDRGITPYPMTLLTLWSLAILFIKWRKLALQKRALCYPVIPDEPDFVLSPLTADQILGRVRGLTDNPAHFMLFSRIERCLSNLKNLGRVADVADILRSQAENDENYTESTYTLTRGFVWAIPVFGFIGTVLGLSEAIGKFGLVLGQGAEMDQLREALRGVTHGLSVAFETTLIGLVGAVIVQLLLNAIRRQEEQFLDECNEYCHRNIISKLRTLGLDQEIHEGAKP